MEALKLFSQYTYVLVAFVVGFLLHILLSYILKKESDEDNVFGSKMQNNLSPAPTTDEDVEHVPYVFERYNEQEMINRSEKFYQAMDKRRSIRFFSSDPVPRLVIDNLIRTAGTSPSGAHCQPWTFVVISDPLVKSDVRRIVEAEEKENYTRRMGAKWVNDLKPFKTTWSKPYLEKAPYLIVVLKQIYGIRETGERKTHYYNEISTSISCGILLAAIQNAGLVTLTSTPMNSGPSLRSLLKRPANEKVLLLLPVGYPAYDATVPNITRKSLHDIMVYF